jgi:SsrA-binding protein
MKITNRKAKYNYNLLEKFEAGISLLGAEVKSIKNGQMDLSGSYGKILGDEAYLINANIPVEGVKDYNSSRSRKLLLHKGEIISINTKIKAKKLTLVPTKVYTKGPLVKIELALAKSKKKFQKKDLIRKKDIERELERQLKEKTKI